MQKIVNNTIHIAFCTDENYAKYMGIAMTSIVLNNIGEKICFHIIYSNLLDNDKNKLLQFEKLYRGIEMRFYYLNDFNSYQAQYHLTKEAFYRLMLPELISNDIEKIIYLDCDILCLGNIRSLWNHDLGDFSLAVRGYIDNSVVKRLKMMNSWYFNSGVLLINTEKWRSEKIKERCIDAYSKNPGIYEWADQDLLNELLDGNCVQLEERYNKFVDCASAIPSEISNNDIIIHYVGYTKPWKAVCFSERRHIWWEYAKKSLWYDLKPEEPHSLEDVLFVARKLVQQGQAQDAIRYYEGIIEYFLQNNR